MSQNFLPTVKFEPAPIDLEAEYLYFFAHTEKRFSATMNKIYPGLESAIDEAENEGEGLIRYREFAEDVIKQNASTITSARDSIESDWNVVGNEFLNTLAEHFETDWPRDKSVITGYVSILPAFPRFLDKYSFCVGYKVSTAKAREIVAHEILHFLWFKKWSEVFPEISKEEYESPHLPWRISEIMDPIILQCHPRIKSLIQPTSWGYASFKELKIGNIGISEYFADIYKKCVQEGKSFGDTLAFIWKKAQENREVLSKF